MEKHVDSIIKTVFGDSWLDASEETRNMVRKLIKWIFKYPTVATLSERDEKIMSSLQLACIELFGFTMGDLMTGNRKRDNVEKRYMVFCTARDLSKSSHYAVAKMFPEKDRTTVLYHARHKLNELCEIDKKTEALYKRFHSATEDYLNHFSDESSYSN